MSGRMNECCTVLHPAVPLIVEWCLSPCCAVIFLSHVLPGVHVVTVAMLLHLLYGNNYSGSFGAQGHF